MNVNIPVTYALDYNESYIRYDASKKTIYVNSKELQNRSLFGYVGTLDDEHYYVFVRGKHDTVMFRKTNITTGNISGVYYSPDKHLHLVIESS